MSSLRNAVKRVAHKERSQPQSRQHLGILEKKKDYKKRAVDYHRKEDRVKAMQQKAAVRNPDEFYFGMNKTQVKDGKHQLSTEERDLSPDLIRLMKDQDLSYVRMQKQKDARIVERLKASLHLTSGSGGVELDGGEMKVQPKRKHTIFVETGEQAETFDVAHHFDTLPEIAGRAFNRPRKETLRRTALEKASYGVEGVDGEENKPTARLLEAISKSEWKQARMVARAQSTAYGELEARTQRAAALERAEAHLVTEKLLQSKGRKRKIKSAEDGRPAQYKWRRKRLG
jgi:U3 small nucleolar RNA-associated protein 11